MNALQLVGRLHPLLVHFPIALLVLAGGGEAVRLISNRPGMGVFVLWALGLGAGGSVLALSTGFLFANEYHPQPSLHWMLKTHQWLGLLTVVSAIVAWNAARVWIEAPPGGSRWARRGLVWLTTGLLAVTAHFGALMVWGADYFSQN